MGDNNTFSVTFTYKKTSNGKSLSSDYGGDYNESETNELLNYIIDSILPCCDFNNSSSTALSNAWDDYKYEYEKRMSQKTV